MELYEIEMAYTEEIYTSIGLVEDVNRFVRYNANKGLMNLGLEPFDRYENAMISSL